MRQLFVCAGIAAGLAACATATTPLEGTDAAGGGGDGPRIDASMIDARMIDAAGPCTPTTANLLTNPAFEMMITGWMETQIGTAAIVRTDGTPSAHTPTYRAWMGGVVAPFFSTVTDALWQDVMIPPSTTQLVLTGFYDVRTAETSATAFDTGSVAIVTTANNAVIETALAVSNLTPKTAWTPFTKTIALPAVVGQTVRLRLTTKNDDFNATSFHFDSLALTAMYCP